jgi:acyl-CoA synthetase (NDP forming)
MKDLSKRIKRQRAFVCYSIDPQNKRMMVPEAASLRSFRALMCVAQGSLQFSRAEGESFFPARLYNLCMDPSLSPFFQPRGIVIVGASSDPAKLGYSIARNMHLSGYPGAVHYVNPKGGELFGQPIHPALSEVPDPVDLAVLIVPAPATPSTLQQVAERGIPAAIISSGGFREVGPEGAALEAECLRIAREHKMRLIGPNCIGLIDYHLPLDTSFIHQPPPPRGSLALISQSGAVCGLIMDWARMEASASPA